MKKIIIRMVLGLVVLLIVALVAVSLSLDGIVKRSIETIGLRVTKVDVKLDKVGLSVLSGSGTVDGLVVGNPKGFSAAQSISVGSVSLAVSPGSLLSSKIVVKSIKLEGPEITLEIGAQGSNLKTILANVNEGEGSDGNAAAQPSEGGRKLEVDDFLITGAKLHLSITGVGSATVPLPQIHLTDLGQGDAGITAAELTKRLLAAIEATAAKVASENAGNLAKQATSLAKGLTGGAGNAVSNATSKLGQGLGDLFKKN